MNRETSFRTSDTLVVTDRSRQRRWVIIGAVIAVLVIVGALMTVSYTQLTLPTILRV